MVAGKYLVTFLQILVSGYMISYLFLILVRKDIANIAVENILNSVVRALWDYPDRK